MKLKRLCVIIFCICLCYILTGCGAKDESKTAGESEEAKSQETQNNSTELRPEIKTANTWMSMPENVDMYWKSEAKSEDDYETFIENKRGNNVMRYGERVTNGKVINASNNGIANEYYYYHYQGDYTWSSYVYFHDQYWDYWYFVGNYPSSPQAFCFGKPWNILDNYSDEHETVNIEGVGAVDTVKGVDDEGYTYYYSKDLNMNVKIENKAQTWSLTKFVANVTTGFPHELPDMKTLDAKREAEKKATETENTENTDDDAENYYIDENGEIVPYDE